MADTTTDDSEDRGAAKVPKSRSVALADETADELPALLAIALGVAVIAIAIVWPSIANQDASLDASSGASAQVAADVDDTDVDDEVADPAGVEDQPGDEVDGGAAESDETAAAPDIEQLTQAIAAGLPPGAAEELSLEADGGTVTVTGVVADETIGSAIIQFVSVQPGVTSVVDQLTVAEPAEVPESGQSDVTVTASQVSVVLSGVVADEATAQALVDKASEVYSVDQIDNQLTVDEAATVPAGIRIDGAMTDEVLYDQVLGAFDGVAGTEVVERTIQLEESGDLESTLNSLAPIEFASGSAIVQPESEAILDEAADALIASPDVVVEIGGHTDSIGPSEGNDTLSTARAQAVLDALVTRGVTNEMTAVGFGESRLKVDPDVSDLAAQQTNRRIEYRIVSG